MADTAVLAERAFTAASRTLSVLEKHAPERAEQIKLLTFNGLPPGRVEQLWEQLAWSNETQAALAELLGKLLEENAPKKRGRPRKQEQEKKGS